MSDLLYCVQVLRYRGQHADVWEDVEADEDPERMRENYKLLATSEDDEYYRLIETSEDGTVRVLKEMGRAASR